MGTIRDLFVQIETFVLFLACVTVKNRLPVPLPLEHGQQRQQRASERQHMMGQVSISCHGQDVPLQQPTLSRCP